MGTPGTDIVIDDLTVHDTTNNVNGILNRKSSLSEGDPFLLASAEDISNFLSKRFCHLNGHVAKKSTSAGAPFSHSERCCQIGEKYAALKTLLSRHACLHLNRDCMTRVYQFEVFISNLKKLVQQELASWYAIDHSKDSELENHQTNLPALSSICDEFRMHLNHWTCIKQRIHNNKWLRSLLPSVSHEVVRIKHRFVRLQETALWWTDKLLRAGIQVFAYVDRRTLSQNDVFSIVRGIEEYNSLLLLVKQHTQEMLSPNTKHSANAVPLISTEKLESGASRLVQCPLDGCVESSTLKQMTFLKLLHSLAFEWAKSAVSLAIHAIDNNEDLLNSMKLMERTDARESVKQVAVNTANTSDYHSGSHSSKLVTSSVIDLAHHASPLLDFGKKEKEYIIKVIQIACQRTSLLRKNKMARPETSSVSSEGDIPITEQVPGFNRHDPRRKSVSWSDSHDIAVCRQLTARYEDALWKAFGSRLADSLQYELHWSRPSDENATIGCLDLCPPTSHTKLVDSVRAAAQKAYFSAQATQPVLTAMALMKARMMKIQCVNLISQSLATIPRDKCTPTPLIEGRKSTQTGMHLRNSLLLAAKLLLVFEEEQSVGSLTKHKGNPSDKYAEYKVHCDTMSMLEVILSMGEKWCRSKSSSFLHDYKLTSLVLINYGDLNIIITEIRKILHTVNKEMFANAFQQFSEIAERLELLHRKMNAQMSSKAKELTCDIMAKEMPPVKTWRRKNVQEAPLLPQRYAETLVESVGLPIAEGAKYLREEDQISALQTVLVPICQSWTSYFLQRKVKFSLSGVHQLQVDFCCILNMIDATVSDQDVKNQVRNSPAIMRLFHIIELLKQQPNEDQTRSHNRIAPVAFQFDSGHLIITANTAEQLEDKSAWLALRLKKTGQHPIFPCLSLKNG